MRFFMKKNSVVFLFLIAPLANAYSFKKLTVLGDAMPSHSGPFFVRQSLISGLSSIGFPFNVNPPANQVGDAVVVLSGINNLQTAMQWKASGKISYLIGGPNIMNSPKEFNYLLVRNELDACLVPSYWIQVAYEEDAPSLKERLRCWFAGVDTNYWQSTQKNKNKVLIYWKTESKPFCDQVEYVLRHYGYDPVRIRYGSYNQETYKKLLDQSQFAVFITRSESQGIALAEAWAMDVPTLNFDPGSLTYRGRTYSIVSSCPYLTKFTGKTWKTMNDFEFLLKKYGEISKFFSPRKWICQNMSDQISAQQLLSIIETLSTQ